MSLLLLALPLPPNALIDIWSHFLSFFIVASHQGNKLPSWVSFLFIKILKQKAWQVFASTCQIRTIFCSIVQSIESLKPSENFRKMPIVFSSLHRCAKRNWRKIFLCARKSPWKIFLLVSTKPFFFQYFYTISHFCLWQVPFSNKSNLVSYLILSWSISFKKEMVLPYFHVIFFMYEFYLFQKVPSSLHSPIFYIILYACHTEFFIFIQAILMLYIIFITF